MKCFAKGKARSRVLLAALFVATGLAGGSTAARAAQHWFSGPVPIPGGSEAQTSGLEAMTPRLFDVVVSIHNNPAGDDDGSTQGVDPMSAEQDVFERIFQHFADGVYESTEGAHKIRKVRIFRNGQNSSIADIIWDAKGHPQANGSGITDSGLHIYMYDVFAAGGPGGADYDLLGDEIGAGYTVAHEWGHYAYGVKDEYVLESTDVAVMPSIMSSQWNATSGDTRWLNFSIAHQGDPAGDFQNTLRTAQHRQYGESCWETLARDNTFFESLVALLPGIPERRVYPELAMVAPMGADVPSFPDLPGDARSDLEIIWMGGDLTYEVVIDKSGSMDGIKIANARTAAKLLVDLAQEGTTQIGVIAFDDVPRVVVPITAIADAAAKDTIKAGIDGIDAGGGTAIGGAATLALNQLLTQADQGGNRVVFLLSDGLSGDNALTPIPDYQANQIPLLTFAYGDDADTFTLGRMAELTSGRLFISPTTLAEVAQAFQDANAVASNSATVTSNSAAVPAGQTSQFDIQIDSTLASFSVAVTYPGSPGDATLSLIAPNGDVLAPVRSEPSGGETLALFAVDAPAQGTYVLEVAAASSDLDVSFQVNGVPAGETFTLAVFSPDGSAITYPEPLRLVAALGKELPIAGAEVVVVLTAPDGTQTEFPMRDDGMFEDVTANDGLYTAVVAYDQAGTYGVEVRASNDSGAAMLTSSGLEPSAGVDGNMVGAPADTPVGESFTRSTRIQIQTQGVLADDHGDTPAAATAISADNQQMTAGRIDRPGDVDVFRVALPAEADEVVVRISELALGMDPRLRILDSDGVTVLTEGTLESNASDERGYLFLRAGATPGAIVYAEVSHIDAEAFTGTYTVSAGSALSTDSGGTAPRGGGSGEDDGCHVPAGSGARASAGASWLLLIACAGLVLRQKRARWRRSR